MAQTSAKRVSTSYSNTISYPLMGICFFLTGKVPDQSTWRGEPKQKHDVFPWDALKDQEAVGAARKGKVTQHMRVNKSSFILS